MRNSVFNEREALRLQLESLLKLRAELRIEYANREKALAMEVAELITNIRNLDNREPHTTSKDVPGEQDMDDRFTNHIEQTSSTKVRKERTSINYEEVTRIVKNLLKASDEPVTLREITRTLTEEHNITLSNPYITIKKVLGSFSNVEESKQGKQLCFFWKHN
ncbi:hypothetical protein [Brevibacillus reuszeri]|uniref:hypothetical protein n=1 Tax=Brevibacillus reuszeri TaxID=54915 RepID=UPI0013E0E42B|nr:hypothetical protein [Brevibacillus reuszeri]